MDPATNDELRRGLTAIRPDGDLVELADDLRRMGVDSLLLCRPDGQIRHVVTEHRIRRLAQPIAAAMPAGLAYIPGQPAGDPRDNSAECERIRAQSG